MPSSWKVVVQDLSLFKKSNDNNRSPTKTLGDDDIIKIGVILGIKAKKWCYLALFL